MSVHSCVSCAHRSQRKLISTHLLDPRSSTRQPAVTLDRRCYTAQLRYFKWTEISIRTVSQDEVSVELPLQDFEVYKMNLENSVLWKMKTWVELGRGGLGLGD